MRCTRNFGSAGSEFNVVHRGPVHADMIGIIDALVRNDSILNDAWSVRSHRDRCKVGRADIPLEACQDIASQFVSCVRHICSIRHWHHVRLERPPLFFLLERSSS